MPGNQSTKLFPWKSLLWLSLLPFNALATDVSFRVTLTPNPAPTGSIEICGVEADAFNPRLWESNKLNFVPDIRFPLLAPQPGRFRNIYAPSAVETPAGFRVFYGAWDGIQSGNDHIYSAETDRNFQNFINRHAVISPGNFTHVCNVNALGLDSEAIALYATVYPVDGQNRPGFFESDATGTNWNGRMGEPYTVRREDIVSLAGYSYTNADINGMNVMLREAGQYRLYFGDFHNLPGVFRASGNDGKRCQFEAKVFKGSGFVNDVKKFRVGDNSYYLMGLHENGPNLWFTVSTNALAFPPAQRLFANASNDDHYIVALGWVTRGSGEQPGRKLLGVLYGAGSVPSLDQNRIHARWLQKQVVFVTNDGQRYFGSRAKGPNCQFVELPGRTSLRGHFEVHAEDGETLIGTSSTVEVKPGLSYQLVQP